MRAAMVACSVAGTLTSATSAVADVAPRLPAQHAAFGEVAHDLLGEEWVTGGARGDRLAQPVDRGVRRRAVRDQCRGLRITQRRKRNRLRTG